MSGTIGQPVVLVGAPIKHAFDGDAFDATLRTDLLGIHAALAAAGMTVRSAHVAEGFTRLPADVDPGHVVRRDRGWMEECNVYVAVLPCDEAGRLVPSIGTAMELGWAAMLGKPSVVIAPRTILTSGSPMVRGLGAIAPTRYLDLDAASEQPWLCVDAVRASLALARGGPWR